jgi:hypothetical protein
MKREGKAHPSYFLASNTGGLGESRPSDLDGRSPPLILDGNGGPGAVLWRPSMHTYIIIHGGNWMLRGREAQSWARGDGGRGSERTRREVKGRAGRTIIGQGTRAGQEGQGSRAQPAAKTAAGAQQAHNGDHSIGLAIATSTCAPQCHSVPPCRSAFASPPSACVACLSPRRPPMHHYHRGDFS